jgi:hypothetical protein
MVSVRLSARNRFRVRIGRVPTEIRFGHILSTNQALQPVVAAAGTTTTTITTLMVSISMYQRPRKTLGSGFAYVIVHIDIVGPY